MKVIIKKNEYPRKAPGFVVSVTDDDGVGLCTAHPETNEPQAKIAAAAFASLIKTQSGRALLLAAVATDLY